MKLKKPNFSQWKTKGRKLLWWAGEHAFLVTMTLILIAGLLAGIVFYHYILSFPNQIPGDQKSDVNFDDALFQEILQEQDQRAKERIKAQELTPQDIFTP